MKKLKIGLHHFINNKNVRWLTNGNEVTLPSIWRRINGDISYDSGKVMINTLKGDIQLELTDVFGAGDRNLIIPRSWQLRLFLDCH